MKPEVTGILPLAFPLQLSRRHQLTQAPLNVSRLLTTLLLYRNGFYVGRYISLEAKIAKGFLNDRRDRSR